MKKFLVFAAVLLAKNVYAQDLSFDQTLLLASKNEESIDSYLGAKGWEQAPTKPSTSATWAYGRREAFSTDFNEKKYEARAWFCMISMEGLPGITYDILSAAKFQAMKQRAASLGFIKTSSEKDDETSTTWYSNAKYKVGMLTVLNQGGVSSANSYAIIILRKNK